MMLEEGTLVIELTEAQLRTAQSCCGFRLIGEKAIGHVVGTDQTFPAIVLLNSDRIGVSSEDTGKDIADRADRAANVLGS